MIPLIAAPILALSLPIRRGPKSARESQANLSASMTSVFLRWPSSTVGALRPLEEGEVEEPFVGFAGVAGNRVMIGEGFQGELG
jgi:hypothetical protein